MSLPIELPDGTRGELLELRGERARLHSPVPWAAGQPVRFTALLGEGRIELQGRCQGARRLPDGRFEARVRLVNLSRKDREALGAALTGAGPQEGASG